MGRLESHGSVSNPSTKACDKLARGFSAFGLYKALTFFIPESTKGRLAGRDKKDLVKLPVDVLNDDSPFARLRLRVLLEQPQPEFLYNPFHLAILPDLTSTCTKP